MAFRDFRVLAAFDPQDDLVAPRVAEGGVETVELLPIVPGPQDLGP
jgi:hypothetical protein